LYPVHHTAATEFYTLSLHDALPICAGCCPLPPARAILIGEPRLIGDRLGDGFSRFRRWPLRNGVFLVHPDDLAEIAGVGEIMLTGMRVPEGAVPVDLLHLDIGVAWLYRRHDFGPAGTLDQHVLPALRERLHLVAGVTDIVQGVRAGVCCFLVIRRARTALGIGSQRRLVSEQVVDLALDTVDDDVRLAA